MALNCLPLNNTTRNNNKSSFVMLWGKKKKKINSSLSETLAYYRHLLMAKSQDHYYKVSTKAKTFLCYSQGRKVDLFISGANISVCFSFLLDFYFWSIHKNNWQHSVKSWSPFQCFLRYPALSRAWSGKSLFGSRSFTMMGPTGWVASPGTAPAQGREEDSRCLRGLHADWQDAVGTQGGHSALLAKPMAPFSWLVYSSLQWERRIASNHQWKGHDQREW